MMKSYLWNTDKFGDNVALLSETGEQLTYRELAGEVQKLGEVFADGGKCLVFSLCSNTIGSVLGYVAFLQRGIVPVMLSRDLDKELLGQLLEKYLPAYIWCPADFALAGNKVGFDGGEICAEDETIYEVHGYKLVKTGFEEKYPIHEDLALLLTTSGSTGSPKFVRQSYENITTNTRQIINYLPITTDEKTITTLPMNYTYGLSIINTHLAQGATILLTDKSLMQREFWQFFKEAGATSFGGVPYTYEILDKLRFARMNLPTLRYMTQAGGKLNPELHKKFAEDAATKGRKFFVMYGQCEATARMAYLPAEDAQRKQGYMGVPVSEGRFELVGEAGGVISEPDVAGELVYYGKNVTMGYAESYADLALGDERHGKLATGDMAMFDAEGYYRIVGRKKRFLKIYGNRVNLEEIENLCRKKYPAVQLACGGVDDHLYVFLEKNAVVSDAGLTAAQDVKNFLAEKTNLNIKAFHVVELEKIPRNDVGKVLYKELGQYYE